MNTITTSTIREFLVAVADAMEFQKSYLIELDSAMGDGDLGLTMTKAFSGAVTAVGDLSESDSDSGKVLITAGMAMAKAAPSTMGTLMATGFMRAGKALRGKETLDASDIALLFRAFADGLRDRGKAVPGEKTVLDVIEPVALKAEALCSTVSDIASLASTLEEEAESAYVKSKDMVAKHGRQAYYGEKSRGMIDPGATVALELVRAFRKTLSDRHER